VTTATAPVLRAALEPITVGTMSLSHRLFVPTHGGGAGSITADDSRFEDLVQYWLGRVDDGFEWIGGPTGHVKHVHIPGFEPTGVGALGKEAGIFRHPRFHARMTEFVDRVHAKGAYLGVQLVQQGGMPSAPSSTFSGYLDHRGVHVLSHDEITWIISEYIASAGMAAEAGVDSIELHANHDDMIEWFLSPLTNRRSDEYGGTFDNRLRFLREIVDGIRAEVGRPITLGLRLAMDQGMEDGYGLEDCIRFMQTFEADGTVDYFNLDVGGNWGPVSYIQHGMYPEANWAELCGQAKQATSLPVLYVGRVVHAETAERVIASGQADMVGMVRALIADPEWLRKTRDGRVDEVRPCIALNECIHRYTLEGLSFGCGINARAGREWKAPVTRTDRTLSVLVVGGGPAGMELAACSAERGHEVTLWEAKAELGGRFAVAAQLRANAPYQDWIDWSADRLPRLGVDVFLGRRAEVQAILDAQADVVAFATGARGRRPGIPGEFLPHVTGADAIILGTARPLGRRVLVLAVDDGPAPLTVADHVAHLGHDVVLAFETPGPAPLVGKYSAGAMFASLDEAGVEILQMARAVEIHPTSVDFAHAYSGRRYTVEGIDSVVLVTGGIGNDALFRAVSFHHPRTHLLGDAFAPRRMTFATRQAFELAQLL
jgi:2,4-dienoyl-CoA reductase-like NADH-dependent reductase (Old Yellow Enzyme family)/NADPH-dependent 2,4-dienoyl-CoA reductase/sulfur reductase-like enzyme